MVSERYPHPSSHFGGVIFCVPKFYKISVLFLYSVACKACLNLVLACFSSLILRHSFRITDSNFVPGTVVDPEGSKLNRFFLVILQFMN